MTEISGPGLLDDITVLDISSFAAAPTAAAMLADLGANVIKVETIGGDPIRGLLQKPRMADDAHDPDHPFQFMNRGKRSIELDLKSSEGTQVIHKLVAEANIVILNMLADRRKRMQIDVDQLHAIKPDLVIGLLTGYGESGPDINRPGYDITAFFGRSGLLGALSGPVREGKPPPVPPRTRPAQGDHTTSMAFFGALMAGLRRRDQTGEGQVVEVSLMHTAAFTIGADLSAAVIDGRPKYSRPRTQTIAPMMESFPCADGRWIQLCMPERGKTWATFCEVIGRSDLIDHPDYSNPRDRFTNVTALMQILDEVISAKTFDEWSKLLDEGGCIWGPINDPSMAAADPQMNEAGVFAEIEHPQAGTFKTVAVPFKIRGDDTIGPQGPAPERGEHSDEILLELGYDSEAVSDLRQRGIIA